MPTITLEFASPTTPPPDNTTVLIVEVDGTWGQALFSTGRWWGLETYEGDYLLTLAPEDIQGWAYIPEFPQ